jgi:transposase
MTNLTYQPKDYNAFIGLDVDKNNFSFTICNHAQQKISKRIPSNPEHLYNYIKKEFDCKKVICAYEAGPTGFNLYDYLRSKGISCFITTPSSIPKAPNERVKNNRIDSGKIADHLMSGKLKPIRVPEGTYRELRHLAMIREEYSAKRKVAKQQIKALLLYENLYSLIQDAGRDWSIRYLHILRIIPCSFAVRQRLDRLLDDLDYAHQKLLWINKTLTTYCQEHEEIRPYIHYLQSIPGIGFVIAVSILGKIGDPVYLRNPRELAAFMGLVPIEHSTGDSIHRGSITRLGDKTIRFMMIEAAWVAIRFDKQLGQFYYRVKSKHHSHFASKVAITAVARKLTQIIYRVLKDKREYIQY